MHAGRKREPRLSRELIGAAVAAAIITAGLGIAHSWTGVLIGSITCGVLTVAALLERPGKHDKNPTTKA